MRRTGSVGGVGGVAVVAALAACGGGDEPRQEGPPHFEVVEEMRIGSLDGDEAYTFGYVADVEPAPDGGVYVADSQGPSLRRYDADGVHVADIGRPGEGPGEFQTIAALAGSPDGGVVVWDPATQRLSIFDPAGEPVRTMRVGGGMYSPDALHASPEGDLYMRVVPETGYAESRAGVPSDWARVGPEGELERLAALPIENAEGPRYVLSGRGGLFRPFNTATVVAGGPDGSVYEARNDEYRIVRRYPGGDTAVIQREEPRVRLAPEEKAEWEARSRWFIENRSSEPGDVLPIPDEKPFIRSLLVDAEGRLWVSRYTEAVFVEYSPEEAADRREQGLSSYQWRDAARWDLFGPDNELVGVVALPQKTSLLASRGDLIWGVQAGPFREDYIVRFRMVPVGER